MKLTLLISSLLTLLLLAGAAVRENYFTEWRRFQREYKEALLAKARNPNERDLARQFSVGLRQAVVPDLGNVDRCVSCHVGIDDPRMADIPQPLTSHPGDYLSDHDVDRFGCTACHGGQGRATTKKEAHATEDGIFWERPILPTPLNQASCGICHDPDSLKNKGAPILARGAELFRESGCQGCHKLGERGGTMGPALDTEGDKTKHIFPFAAISGERTVANWHREHFKDPKKVIPKSKMPKVDLNDEELESLLTYILSLRRPNLTERMTPRDKYEERYRTWHPEPVGGETLYRRFCFSCHGKGVGTEMLESIGLTLPAIRNPAFIATVSDDFLFKSIRKGRPETEMPAWGQPGGGLSDDEIRRLVDYLSGDIEKKDLVFVPSPQSDPANGKAIFKEECTSCHNISRAGVDAPWLGGPGFQEDYDDALIGVTIKYGRRGTDMDPYGKGAGGDLTDQEISDLIAFIRTLGR